MSEASLVAGLESWFSSGSWPGLTCMKTVPTPGLKPCWHGTCQHISSLSGNHHPVSNSDSHPWSCSSPLLGSLMCLPYLLCYYLESQLALMLGRPLLLLHSNEGMQTQKANVFILKSSLSLPLKQQDKTNHTTKQTKPKEKQSTLSLMSTRKTEFHLMSHLQCQFTELPSVYAELP